MAPRSRLTYTNILQIGLIKPYENEYLEDLSFNLCQALIQKWFKGGEKRVFVKKGERIIS